MNVKILKRSADFTPQLVAGSTAGAGKLQIPKKTKLFVDQTMRERENSIGKNTEFFITNLDENLITFISKAMHRTFQKYLFHSKLDTARQLVRVIAKKQVPTTINDTVKISANVLGLGPSFRLHIGLCNISPDPLMGLGLFFHWDDKFYELEPGFIHVVT